MGRNPGGPADADGRGRVSDDAASRRVGQLAAQLEAVLFTAAEPLTLGRLASVAGVPEAQVRRALAELAAHLDAHGHGVALSELAGGFQLLTRPEHAAAVSDLAAPRHSPLSRAALETLAIVAFKQPVTRAAIDEVRGVQSEGAIATLLERGLIGEGGRAEAPGRPILYITTRRFLEYFGLRALEELSIIDGQPALPSLGPGGPRVRRLIGSSPEADG